MGALWGGCTMPTIIRGAQPPAPSASTATAPACGAGGLACG
ncbi:hypothetical protein [Limnohabitans sp.]